MCCRARRRWICGAGDDAAGVAEHGEEQDAQEQMQQHQWLSRPPSPPARLRSAAVSLLPTRSSSPLPSRYSPSASATSPTPGTPPQRPPASRSSPCQKQVFLRPPLRPGVPHRVALQAAGGDHRGGRPLSGRGPS